MACSIGLLLKQPSRTFLVCADFILAVQVTYKSALAMKDQAIPHPSSQVVEWVGALLIVLKKIFID